MNMGNMVNRDLVKTAAWGAGVGAAGTAGLSTVGIGLMLTGAAMAVPPVAAGAVLGGLVGLAYGLGKQQR
jgi:hypothetical protein